MFLLDMNVVSDLRRPRRITAAAANWLRAAPVTQLHISVLTVFEIEHGIGELRRRDAARAEHLQRWLETAVLAAFDGRIVPIDTAVARRSASLHSGRSRLSTDLLIAATALAHDLTLVTRNIADFKSTGVRMLDPFAPQ